MQTMYYGEEICAEVQKLKIKGHMEAKDMICVDKAGHTEADHRWLPASMVKGAMRVTNDADDTNQ